MVFDINDKKANLLSELFDEAYGSLGKSGFLNEIEWQKHKDFFIKEGVFEYSLCQGHLKEHPLGIRFAEETKGL